MSFGALVRLIPTSESNWDFGMGDKVSGYIGGALENTFFKDHPNEAGWLNDSYIRNEDKIYFNAMPKDRRWSFYAALEHDSALETSSVDARGGKTSNDSNFGLERLHVTMALPAGLRLHAGWDIWTMDTYDAAAMVYGDDNPGFWITGDYDAVNLNIGYFKLCENDFQTSIATLNGNEDDDRDLYAGYLTYIPNPNHKIQTFYAYDRIRNISAKDFLAVLSSGTAGIVGDVPDTDSHHIGAYYVGKFGHLELFGEGVYQFGKAEQTGLATADFDIAAYALAFDAAFEFKGKLTGFPMKPHLGIMYTSGDDDPDDDTLGGYNGVVNAQRYSKHWGGENTIIGDTNFVLGSMLYGYLPELYGNGTPVFTGGLQNTSDLGSGRGDNPGMTLISLGLTVAPRQYLIFKTNANMFYWNEDFVVTNMVTGTGNTTVEGGYVGTEWDNELTFVTSKNTYIKAQASFFFPGQGIEDVTEALSGTKSDDMAMRIAAELIWNF